MTKFYLKVMLKSPIFIISMLFTLFIMVVQMPALKVSINLFARVNFYGYISFNLFLLVSCTYVMNKDYQLAKFLERNTFKKFLATILTTLVISSIVFIIPLIVICIYKWNEIAYIDFFQGIFNYFILWSLSNCLAGTIGSTMGVLVKKWYSYILSFILYLVYMSHLYGPPKSILDRLICIFSDNIFIEENNLAPILFNTSYFIDKAFSVLIILAIINFVYLALNFNKRKNVITSIISLVAIAIMLVSIVQLNNKLSKMGTESYDDFQPSEYIIEDYKMDLKLASNLENSCELDIKVLNDTNNLTFMLDNIFKVDSIYINDNPYNFQQRNNEIMLNSSFDKDQILKVKVNYSGFVDISTSIGVNTYYVNNRYINLPSKKFYWYPCIDDNLSHNFNIKLSTDTNIYSNLNVENLNKNGNQYEYELSGDDTGLNIFAGDYQVINDKDIEYVMPKTYKLNVVETRLNDCSIRLLEKSLSEESKLKSDFLKNKSYKKVIFGCWYSNSIEKDLGNEIQFYKDTIIIK